MSKFEWKINEKTGLRQTSFGAKLLSEISTATEKINTNGKKYRIVSVEFEDGQGKKQVVPANIYEGNFSKGVEKGNSYLCVATVTPDDKVYFQLSHLPSGTIPTLEMFGLASSEVTAKELARA